MVVPAEIMTVSAANMTTDPQWLRLVRCSNSEHTINWMASEAGYKKALEWTVEWYRCHSSTRDKRVLSQLSIQQIDRFSESPLEELLQ